MDAGIKKGKETFIDGLVFPVSCLFFFFFSYFSSPFHFCLISPHLQVQILSMPFRTL